MYRDPLAGPTVASLCIETLLARSCYLVPTVYRGDSRVLSGNRHVSNQTSDCGRSQHSVCGILISSRIRHTSAG